MAPKRTSGRNHPGQASTDPAIAGPSTAPPPPAHLPQTAPWPVPPVAPPSSAPWLLPPTAQTSSGTVPAVPEYLTSFEAFQAARAAAQLPVLPFPTPLPVSSQPQPNALHPSLMGVTDIQAHIDQLEQLLLRSTTVSQNPPAELMPQTTAQLNMPAGPAGYLPQLGMETPYPGMLPPPPSDPQVISLRERLPDVDHAITDRILKGAFTTAELSLLLPADMHPQLRAWQMRLHGTGASTSASHRKEDPDFPPFGHLATAFTMYITVLSFFCPPASSVDLVINMTRYLTHLLYHNKTYTSPAV